MKRMHAENELRQCQHAQQTLEVEKDLLQKDVASLQTQLANKSESLRQSWADANAKVGCPVRFSEPDDIGPNGPTAHASCGVRGRLIPTIVLSVLLGS